MTLLIKRHLTSQKYLLGINCRRCLLLFASIMILLSPSLALSKNLVTNLRNAQHKDYHRIVFELNNHTEYKTFMLPAPPRLVIDLADTNIPTKLSFNPSGIAEDFRYGLFQENISRVVIDLSREAKIINLKFLKPSQQFGYRLVIDFTQGEPSQPKHKAIVSKKWGNFITKKSSPPQVPTTSDKPLIVIDPGHGGLDPGAIGKFYKTKEKHIVLDVSKKIVEHLKKNGKYRVMLTRNKDFFVKLRDRTAIAEKNQADLFVSIHADSFKKSSVRGMSVYALSEKGSDAEARLIAEQENRSDLIAGADLNNVDENIASILIDLQQSESKIESVKFSNYLINSMKKVTDLKRDTLRFASFVVLKAPTVPSILVELGYLSNKYEENLLRKKSHRKKIAKAIADAIEVYFKRRNALLAQ